MSLNELRYPLAGDGEGAALNGAVDWHATWKFASSSPSTRLWATAWSSSINKIWR
jgi:hypothetical protein